jgi:hypothetical protein
MKSLTIAYINLHKATKNFINIYSSNISLDHLIIKDNTPEKEILKNMNELCKYYLKFKKLN